MRSKCKSDWDQLNNFTEMVIHIDYQVLTIAIQIIPYFAVDVNVLLFVWDKKHLAYMKN